MTREHMKIEVDDDFGVNESKWFVFGVKWISNVLGGEFVEGVPKWSECAGKSDFGKWRESMLTKKEKGRPK